MQIRPSHADLLAGMQAACMRMPCHATPWHPATRHDNCNKNGNSTQTNVFPAHACAFDATQQQPNNMAPHRLVFKIICNCESLRVGTWSRPHTHSHSPLPDAGVHSDHCTPRPDPLDPPALLLGLLLLQHSVSVCSSRPVVVLFAVCCIQVETVEAVLVFELFLGLAYAAAAATLAAAADVQKSDSAPQAGAAT